MKLILMICVILSLAVPCSAEDIISEVCVIASGKPGASVYIVAGIHGDEIAGQLAADILKESEISAGTLYILSPANAVGAERNTRTTLDSKDLNRVFPGNASGGEAERIAAAIYADISDISPALVIDLHETDSVPVDRDFLERAIVCASITGIEDAVIDLISEGKFTLYGSPPAGSINAEVNSRLSIPVVTVETWTEAPIDERVADQLAVVRHFLAAFGLIAEDAP